MERLRACDYRAIGNELYDQLWNIVASLGDEIDSERLYSNTDWRIYANELHEWITDLLVKYKEAVK